MSKDQISFLLENGMTLDYIQKMVNEGIPLEELEQSARNVLARGESIVPEEAIRAAVPEFFDGNRFLHNIMGDYLVDNYGVCKIGDAVHIYDGGLYRPGEDALHGIMVELLPSLSDAKRREVFKYIKISRRTPVKELSPPHLIPFRHQIYNLKTGEFLDYSKNYVFLNRFPWDFDPEAPEVPGVTDTLNAIANGDKDVVKLLLEAFSGNDPEYDTKGQRDDQRDEIDVHGQRDLRLENIPDRLVWIQRQGDPPVALQDQALEKQAVLNRDGLVQIVFCLDGLLLRGSHLGVLVKHPARHQADRHEADCYDDKKGQQHCEYAF